MQVFSGRKQVLEMTLHNIQARISRCQHNYETGINNDRHLHIVASVTLFTRFGDNLDDIRRRDVSPQVPA